MREPKNRLPFEKTILFMLWSGGLKPGGIQIWITPKSAESQRAGLFRGMNESRAFQKYSIKEFEENLKILTERLP
jgi:hypothetical protein